MTTEIKNAGGLSLGLGTQGSLTLSLREDAGIVSSPAIFGIDGETFYSHSFDYETDYFLLMPLRAYIDIAFTREERSVYNNRNGLKLFGGAMATAADYGNLFPVLGGGAELYLGTEQSEDNLALFGRLQAQGGALGALDTGSDRVDSYQTRYGGVNLISGLAQVGLNFYEQADLALEGVIGDISRPDEYWGSDWGDFIEGPDAYDEFYGASVRFQFRVKSFKLRLAYYFLYRTGGGYYDVVDQLGFGDVDDSTENSSHRLTGSASFRVVNEDELKLDLGIRGNYYTSDKTTSVTVHPPDDTDFFSSSSWNNERSYFNVYASLLWDFLFIEVGGGYSEGTGAYALGCGPYCSSPEGESSDAGWNLYLKTALKWGGPGGN